jgi:hypothetical protein
MAMPFELTDMVIADPRGQHAEFDRCDNITIARR